MKSMLNVAVSLFSITLMAAASANACATNESGLTGALAAFNSTEEWVENSAGDNRPLRVSVSVDDERIFLTFEKSDTVVDEAQPRFLQRASSAEYTLWGEGPVQICPQDNGYKIVFQPGTRVTSDAHSAMRSNFAPGAQLNLRLNRENNAVSNIRISAGLWGSTFVPNN